MDSIFVGFRLAANDIKKSILEKQLQNNVSNDSMCIILRDVLGDYEAARANDYAAQLYSVSVENEALKNEALKSQKGETVSE